VKRLLSLFAAALLAGCGSGEPRGSGCPGGSPGAEALGSRQPGTMLGGGLVRVPAALAPGEPGSEQVFRFGQAARNVEETQPGQTLVVTLRDAGRPRVTCADDHPLSGCVTIDWFGGGDGSGGGEPLENIVTLDLRSGERTFYLWETGMLASEPPSRRCAETARYTALGGVARRWVGTLPEALAPGSGIGFRLVLTKFGPPEAAVAYAVRVEPS
jgi:hypothetical protein